MPLEGFNLATEVGMGLFFSVNWPICGVRWAKSGISRIHVLFATSRAFRLRKFYSEKTYGVFEASARPIQEFGPPGGLWKKSNASRFPTVCCGKLAFARILTSRPSHPPMEGGNVEKWTFCQAVRPAIVEGQFNAWPATTDGAFIDRRGTTHSGMATGSLVTSRSLPCSFCLEFGVEGSELVS